MPVDADIVFKMRRILWPSVFGQSFWSFGKTLLNQHAATVGEFFGIQPAPQNSFEEILAKHTKRPMITSGKTDESSGNSVPPRSYPESASGKTIPESPTAAKDETGLVNSPSFTGSLLSTMQFHTGSALMAFKTTFLQTWKSARTYPPRGSIIVSGLVELDAPRAWLVVDIKAAWDPKTKSFDRKSMNLSIRRMQMKKQAPLGGYS